MILDWSIFRNRRDLEANLRQIRETEFMRGSLRCIDYSSADERAAVGDLYDCRMAVFLIIDLDRCSERE